ncbi:MAG TPA: paraquat-inducible protein A [Ideonella sp.]|nr:paraquat-inducible protein A [Ideonella sp.]
MLTYPGLVVCEECDAAHTWRRLVRGDVARCTRCGAVLGRSHRLALDGQLALALATAIVFVIGSVSPIVTLELRGLRSVLSLPEAVFETWDSGGPLVAALAAATALVFPGLVIATRLWVLLPLALRRRPAGFVPVLRVLHWVTRWSMVEVFMLGVLIALVRSAGLAQLVLGAGVWAYGALVVLITANQLAGEHVLWERAMEPAP